MKNIIRIQHILILLFFGTAPFVPKAQELVWAKSIAGSMSCISYSMDIDSFGNVYSTGAFWGSVDFDPGPGTYFLNSSGETDIYVHKMDSAGNFLWAKSFGSNTNHDSGYSIAVDTAGNVYTAGRFGGAVDFDPGPAAHNLTSWGSMDGFIHKMDSSGNFLWVKSIRGADDATCLSIDVRDFGAVYTTGWFGGVTDFDPDSGTFNLNPNGGYDVFVQKLNSDGAFVWAKSFGGSSLEYGRSIKSDNNGNIFTAGFFKGTVDFDPNVGIVEVTTNGSSDCFVHKMDSSGNLLWVKTFGGSSLDEIFSISIDESGSIFTAGLFNGTADFDPSTGIHDIATAGSADIFVHKMDSVGNFLWAKTFGGADVDAANDITIDALGNVYTSGYFQGQLDFDPGVGTYLSNSEGSTDMFVLKMDTHGNFVWVQALGGINGDAAKGCKIDFSGNIHIIGSFRGTVDFDTGPGTFNLTTPTGNNGAFVMKLSQEFELGVPKLNQLKVRVYPNPSAGTLYLEFDDTKSNVEVVVSDINGRFVSSNYYSTFLNGQIVLEGTSGVYLVLIKSSEGQTILRLIKE